MNRNQTVRLLRRSDEKTAKRKTKRLKSIKKKVQIAPEVNGSKRAILKYNVNVNHLSLSGMQKFVANYDPDKYHKQLKIQKAQIRAARAEKLKAQREKSDKVKSEKSKPDKEKPIEKCKLISEVVNNRKIIANVIPSKPNEAAGKVKPLRTEKLKGQTENTEKVNLDKSKPSRETIIEKCKPVSEVASTVLTVSLSMFNDETRLERNIKRYSSWPVRFSLFRFVPPYISFIAHDNRKFVVPEELRDILRWRTTIQTPMVVKRILVNTGFHLALNAHTWDGTWGGQKNTPDFALFRNIQKFNHFPGTYQLGRKDNLCKNLQRMIMKHGYKCFTFVPHTFLMPQDIKALKQVWDKSENTKWIVKPPAGARGSGIRVIHRWEQLPLLKSTVVQQYISNPYLINGSKFDLRLYVLMTSINPLRIFLYKDGLARFASIKYSNDISSLTDVYMHLTNYSINKLSSKYRTCKDANSCIGHKWTLLKLMEYLKKSGVNTKRLWETLKRLVIKTIISAEHIISQTFKDNVRSRYNCFELFGIDVLLDNKAKPWLLEVNISPSLHCNSPVDEHVKAPLVRNLLNLVQFHLSTNFKRKTGIPPTLNASLYTKTLSGKEAQKHSRFSACYSRTEYLRDILKDLTGDDVRHLLQAEDELTVMGDFERVFPTYHTHVYFKYLQPRYYNRLFDAWEHRYRKDRNMGIAVLQQLCEKKLHLLKSPTLPSLRRVQSEKQQIPRVDLRRAVVVKSVPF